jgi:hypothetical protein
MILVKSACKPSFKSRLDGDNACITPTRTPQTPASAPNASNILGSRRGPFDGLELAVNSLLPARQADFDSSQGRGVWSCAGERWVIGSVKRWSDARGTRCNGNSNSISGDRLEEATLRWRVRGGRPGWDVARSLGFIYADCAR